jgi:hypothetical protein
VSHLGDQFTDFEWTVTVADNAVHLSDVQCGFKAVLIVPFAA